MKHKGKSGAERTKPAHVKYNSTHQYAENGWRKVYHAFLPHPERYLALVASGIITQEDYNAKLARAAKEADAWRLLHGRKTNKQH